MQQKGQPTGKVSRDKVKVAAMRAEHNVKDVKLKNDRRRTKLRHTSQCLNSSWQPSR